MKDFNTYILSLNFASDYGAVKIIPPVEWNPGQNCDSIVESLKFTPTFQDVNPIKDNVFIQTHEKFKDSNFLT
jgi:hypothetical protein